MQRLFEHFKLTQTRLGALRLVGKNNQNATETNQVKKKKKREKTV